MTAEIIQMRESFPVSTINIEVEQALLGAAMVHGLERLALLKPEHFHDPLHQRLYRTMQTMFQQGAEISPATLKTYFLNDPAMVEVGGPTYLVRLKTAGMEVMDVRQYATVIIELWQRRMAVRVCNETANVIADPYASESFQMVADQIVQRFAEIQAEGPLTRPRRIGSYVEKLVADIQARAAGVDRVPATGLTRLDERIGGWRRGNQVFLAGRPGMGKTALGLWLAYQAAVRNPDFCVIFFSLEMTADECMTRLACDVASTATRVIAYEDVLNGKAHPEDIKRLEATRAALGAANLYIDDQPKRSVPSIMAECRGIAREAAKMGGRLGLVVVDHLRKVADSGNYKNNPNKSEGEKAAMLKDMAKHLDCTVLTLVQLNRGVEGRDDKRPVLSDLRDSGEIEEEADAVCMVYREAYYKAREKIPTQTAAEADWRDELAAVEHIAEVMIAKNRHGQTGRINVGCNMASNKFWTVEERF